MKILLLLSLANNVILFGLLLMYHVISEDEYNKLYMKYRKECMKKSMRTSTKPTFKRV